MSNLALTLMDEISFGILSFKGIADKYDVPISWVHEAWDMLCCKEAGVDYDSWYDEQYEIEDQ